VRAQVVIVVPPCLDDRARFTEAAEHVLVKALVAQLAVERFDDPVPAFALDAGLVARLRLGHPKRRPALPHLMHRRRLQPRVPGGGGRHLARRRKGAPSAALRGTADAVALGNQKGRVALLL